jgi:Ca-activated chloride channel family protein
VAVLLVVTCVALSAQPQTATQSGSVPADAAPAPPRGAAGAPAADGAPPVARPNPGAQAPAFRSGIDIVSMNVTVADSTGRYVTDLEQNEFLVFENGIKQEVSFFTRRQNPIALLMLLDSSASMEGKLPTLQAAAASFVRRLKPVDTAQIVEFDEMASVKQPFTSNHDDLVRAIDELHAGGPTGLHNALYWALKDLKKIEAQVTEESPRRQALVVFSDGADTSSIVAYEEVLDVAKRSETAIYTIGLRDALSRSRGFNNADFVLRQLAQETGGRAFFPSDVRELASVYGQIADELSSQYALGYTSNNTRRDGTWRRIVVQVTRPNATARTKQGYFAPAPVVSPSLLPR